ncbi:CRISPR-associated RAMP protein, Csm3 family [Vulcanisaeta moutnovskia 768-28]|uniref:CRISPR system Cms endoribonuclease Csm3 n=1 Tax=Vulcanisaeta moutnovskia (strain 768-28) TaxID=985053 RepID=F0QTI2_VULM7|nr:type III-A CRISPR-associated RAMP protein Csm3 [Vulcanisaeta moutnovskia]ADY01695.1 CRISPR-associated RAMP protein, Csm3 family [Vulcanisaeta moutnovskia 768-28]
MSQYLSPKIRLVGAFELGFKLVARSGLLIRSGRAKEIMGAADIEPLSITRAYAVGKNTYLLKVPYIPGSSLKGKARSLLELALGLDLHTTDGKIYYHSRVISNNIVHDDPYCPVDNVFGSMSMQPLYFQPSEEGSSPYSWFFERCWAPSRAIFRDMYPSQGYIERLCQLKGGCDNVYFEDFLEEKGENRIDRVTSAADPRTVLRVRADVEFEGSITLLVYDVDICRRRECDEHSRFKEFIKDYPARYYLSSLIDSLILVEETYIGGSGTRGYGNVEFRDLVLKFQNLVKGDVGFREIHKADGLLDVRDFVDKTDVFNELRDLLCK